MSVPRVLAAGYRVCMLAAVASLVCRDACAALPPGYEDELYCPGGHCLRPRQDMPVGFTGPRASFHECVSASDGQESMRPTPWGAKVGDQVREDLVAQGFHLRKCQESAPAEAAEEDEGVCMNSHGVRPSVHAAFYLWYGNPEVDGRWLHWDHKVLPHWDKQVDAKHPKFNWRPPEEPHSPMMPKRGTYSCRDNATLRAQFLDLAMAGVDSAMCSWWGRKHWQGKRDDAFSGANTDELMPAVLDAAQAAGVGVSFHVEPYGGRTPDTFLDDLRYIHENYGSHPAMYRQNGLPVFWVYDVSVEHSHGDVDAWRQALDSVRGTALDGVFLCLWIGARHGSMDDAAFVERGGFDGAYTYFAAAGFTQGSNPATWSRGVRALKQKGKLFVPAVGPGYDDTLIRPWNAHNVRGREDGAYYDKMWREALASDAPMVSITSYNEWGEGTQIEAAVPYTAPTGRAYQDYTPMGQEFYLERTREWSDKFKQQSCGA